MKAHPTDAIAKKRDALMLEVGQFMDRTYPASIFGESFNRKQVELVAACFVMRKEMDEAWQ